MIGFKFKRHTPVSHLLRVLIFYNNYYKIEVLLYSWSDMRLREIMAFFYRSRLKKNYETYHSFLVRLGKVLQRGVKQQHGYHGIDILE